jgi:hypothetical protein
MQQGKRCDACKFFVDSAVLSVDLHIYAQKGDTPWGDLEMQLDVPHAIARRNGTCGSPHYDRYWSDFVSAGDNRFNLTVAEGKWACDKLMHTKEVFEKISKLFMAEQWDPMMMLAERYCSPALAPPLLFF